MNKTKPASSKENAVIITAYQKAEKAACAAQHIAAMAKDQDLKLNAAAIEANRVLSVARAAYWAAGF